MRETPPSWPRSAKRQGREARVPPTHLQRAVEHETRAGGRWVERGEGEAARARGVTHKRHKALSMVRATRRGLSRRSRGGGLRGRSLGHGHRRATPKRDATWVGGRRAEEQRWTGAAILAHPSPPPRQPAVPRGLRRTRRGGAATGAQGVGQPGGRGGRNGVSRGRETTGGEVAEGG